MTISQLEEKRDQALETVMRCFWTHGFEAASLGKLEAATGMGRQSLYNAFGSKEEMFTRALDRYRAKVGAPLVHALELDSPEQALRAFLERHLTLIEDDAVPPGCMIASCTSELGPRPDGLGERMRCETAENLEALRSLFRAWKEDGRLSPAADPEVLAPLLAAIMRGLAVLDRGGTDRGDLIAVIDGAIATFRPFLVEPAEARP
jgi:TetR/AcrR family transcriptional repressor of nem operon